MEQDQEFIIDEGYQSLVVEGMSPVGIAVRYVSGGCGVVINVSEVDARKLAEAILKRLNNKGDNR